MKDKYIVHIIRQEKFTGGLMLFFQNKITQYKHRFIIKRVKNSKYQISGCDESNVTYIDSYMELLFDRNVKRILLESFKIVAEGIYGVDIPMCFWRKKLIEKTYMQFWGGDYFNRCEKTKRKRNLKNLIIHKLTKKTMLTCIKRCKAAILLLDSEYKDFVDATGIEKRYFVAPVANDGSVNAMQENVENNPKKQAPYHIIIGNSASESNYHKEALDLLYKFKDEDIKIVCPLSYGPKEYANSVIDYGKKMFGNKFEGVTEFMPKQEYYDFLTAFSVGLFLNDRQEALGNVNALLRFGCKLYLKEGCPVWENCKKLGYSVSGIKEIEEMSIEEFLSFSSEQKEKNREIRKREIDVQKSIDKWLRVLED